MNTVLFKSKYHCHYLLLAKNQSTLFDVERQSSFCINFEINSKYFLSLKVYICIENIFCYVTFCTIDHTICSRKFKYDPIILFSVDIGSILLIQLIARVSRKEISPKSRDKAILQLLNNLKEPWDQLLLLIKWAHSR